jgi:hypothetical protein
VWYQILAQPRRPFPRFGLIKGINGHQHQPLLAEAFWFGWQGVGLLQDRQGVERVKGRVQGQTQGEFHHIVKVTMQLPHVLDIVLIHVSLIEYINSISKNFLKYRQQPEYKGET